MSIRMIARELYRLQQAVDDLEQKIEQAPIDQRDALREQLRKVKAERDHMRNVLDGQKDTGDSPPRKY